MNKALLFSAYWLLLLATSANALDTSTELAGLLEPMVDSHGLYHQRLLDSKGELVQESSGEFAVANPGKFRWATIKPYEQLLVSDGETIWLFDPDLEQVTVKSVASQQSQLPIRILSGELELLAQEFNITRSLGDSGSIFTLTPLQDGAIASVELAFIGEELTTMAVADNTGGKTIFDFSEREPLPCDSDALFEFVIPTDADVFYDQ